VTATLPVFIAGWALMNLLVISPLGRATACAGAPAVRAVALALALARTPNLSLPVARYPATIGGAPAMILGGLPGSPGSPDFGLEIVVAYGGVVYGLFTFGSGGSLDGYPTLISDQQQALSGLFANYNLAVATQYGVPVYTVVLYGARIRSARDTLRLGSLTFTVQNILVGREDGDATLRRLHEKAARGEPFTPGDRIDLVLSPLMRHRRPLNSVLPDAVELSNHLPEGQQGPAAAALIGLTYYYID